MSTTHCRHLKEDGVYCHTPALRGRNYCYSHLRERGRRLAMARERARQQSRPLNLPPLDDLNAINAALTQVALAFTFGRIDQRAAGLLVYTIQQIGGNLKFMAKMAARAAARDAADAEAHERLEEYPGFEAEFGLPEGFDLETPPEVAFPMPKQPAVERSPYRSDYWQEVNPEDIELEEVREKQGEKAYQKRLAELERKLDKKMARKRRVLDEARWVVEAYRRSYAPGPTEEEQRAEHAKLVAKYGPWKEAEAKTEALFATIGQKPAAESAKKPPATVTESGPAELLASAKVKA